MSSHQGTVHASLFTTQSHGPIFIRSNDDFSAFNGVTSGKGTAFDPYVIGGWDIDASIANGIDVRNTTAYFVIRKVHVHSSGSVFDAVHFNNASNGRIESSVLSNSASGVNINGGVDLVITGNNITRNGNGIRVYFAVAIILANNITDNGQGIVLDYAFGVLAHHNNIIRNQLSAQDYGGSGNGWTNGYPSGGNYWSDYTGVDNCSGPSQNICPSPDGIGDTPYNLYNSQDYYPLMKPYHLGKDSSAPEWPPGGDLSIFKNNFDPHSLSLTWASATDDLWVVQYRIYRNSTLMDTVTEYYSIHIYGVGGLAPNTTYTFRIEAGDSSYNWSSDGPTLTVTTPPVLAECTNQPACLDYRADRFGIPVPGGTVIVRNKFTNVGESPIQITNIVLNAGFGVFSPASGIPLNVTWGAREELNMSINIPPSTTPGDYTVTVTIDWQYLSWPYNSPPRWNLAPSLAAHGFLVVEANPSTPPTSPPTGHSRSPISSSVSMAIKLLTHYLSLYGPIVFSLYILLASLGVLVVWRRDRKHQDALRKS